jgi:hypothetical protein
MLGMATLTVVWTATIIIVIATAADSLLPGPAQPHEPYQTQAEQCSATR